ncbi:AAA family ATPase [Rhodococcus opacus]|nr:AAA family ATPase [Rhodococcus opacus]
MLEVGSADHREGRMTDVIPLPTDTTGSAAIVTGDWLDAQEFPPLRWVVYGVIAEGLTILAGAPKLGKSWLALSLALAVAAGEKALGCIDTERARPVLYLALEDGYRRLQFRARQLLDGEPIPENLHLIIKGTRVELRLAIVDWLEEHRDEQPLVIVDTLAKLRPAASKSDSAYDADYSFVGGLKAVIDEITGGAMVLVHHTNKRQDGDFLDAVSGTQGIAGAADATITLQRSRQEKTATLSVTGRDVIESEYSVTSTDGMWTLDGGGLEQAAQAVADGKQTRNVGDRMAEVIKFISSRPETRAADVAAHLGMETNQARSYLSRAHENKRITKVRLGVYRGVAPVAPVADLEAAATHATHATPSAASTEDDEFAFCPACHKPIGRSGKCVSCIASKLNKESA